MAAITPSGKLPGSTKLYREQDVSKADAIFRVIGAIDEASAALGLAKSFLNLKEHKNLLTIVQADLSLLMASLAGWSAENDPGNAKGIKAALEAMESALAEMKQTISLPKKFVHSGQNAASGTLDVARAVARRAEREAVAYHQATQPLDINLLQYLNRLSTMCYYLMIAEIDAAESN